LVGLFQLILVELNSGCGGQPRSCHRRSILACNTSRMTDEASPKGWMVRVTTKRPGRGIQSVEIYDAGIPDPADAVEAVRRACEAGPDTIVEAVAELAWTNLRSGEVLSR
jgi:hypothetical protein